MTSPARSIAPDDWEHARQVAVDVAREAGALLREGWGTRPAIEFKSEDINLVTEFDRRSEALIVARLAAAFPADTIVGEEGSEIGGGRRGGGRVWYVDPLDGTTNFSHGFPLFSVSIGLAVDGRAVAGAVEAPALGWSFSGVVGGGARWNDRAVVPSRIAEVRRALVVTGFPYTRNPQQNNLPEWAALIAAAQGTRRLGSAALDLCFVACGWLDAYWERELHPWDLVAGAAIVNAAGGRATEIDGTPFDGETGRVLATNGVLHDEMVALLGQVAASSGGAWP
ncbi:MAG: inositol monophosphatase family protein [Pseudomonadota bacterium]